MFIVNNKKNTRTTSMTCFSCLLGTYFTPFSSVSIVDLEQIKVRWMYLCRTGLLRLRVGLKRQIYVDSQLKHLCRRFSSVFIIVFQLVFTCNVTCLTLVIRFRGVHSQKSIGFKQSYCQDSIKIGVYPSRYFIIQSLQWIYQNNVSNMFKVMNNHIQPTSFMSFWSLYS